MAEVSDELDCGKNTIKRWLHKLDITTRDKAGIVEEKQWHDKNTLISLYNSGDSLRTIADKFDIDKATISYWMEKHGIERRDRWQARREFPPTHYWNKDGYEISAGRYYETAIHRLIMVAEHGFDCVDDWSKYEVHHKNKHPADNRPENLELMKKPEHSRHHIKENELWKKTENWQNSQT